MKSDTNSVLKDFIEGENPEPQAPITSKATSKARQRQGKIVLRDKASIENVGGGELLIEINKFDVSDNAANAAPVFHDFRVSQLEHLLEMLKEEDAEVRKESVFSLGSLGTKAVPYIRQALDDHDVTVRREAILSLGRIGREAAAAIPDLDRLISREGRKQLGENYNKTIALAALKKIMALNA